MNIHYKALVQAVENTKTNNTPVKCALEKKRNTAAPSIPREYIPRPQWMPENLNSTKPYVYYVFSLHIYL